MATGPVRVAVSRRNTTLAVPKPCFRSTSPARLLEVFPLLLNLIGNVSLGVAALTYTDQFNIMAVADRDAYPDIDVFAAGVREELDVLAASVSPRIVGRSMDLGPT